MGTTGSIEAKNLGATAVINNADGKGAVRTGARHKAQRRRHQQRQTGGTVL